MRQHLLTSRSNQKIKFLESLRKNRERKRAGLFLVEGQREIERAKDVDSLFYHEETPFIEKQRALGVECNQVSKTLLEKISLRNEIVAIGKMKRLSLSSLQGSFFLL